MSTSDEWADSKEVGGGGEAMTMLAMCRKQDCPSYDNCYRAQAEEAGGQAYNDFDNNGESCCDYYIPIKPDWKQKYSSID